MLVVLAHGSGLTGTIDRLRGRGCVSLVLLGSSGTDLALCVGYCVGSLGACAGGASNGSSSGATLSVAEDAVCEVPVDEPHARLGMGTLTSPRPYPHITL